VAAASSSALSSTGITAGGRRLLAYAAPYKAQIALALLCAIVFAAGRVGRAYLMKPLLDDILLPARAPGEVAVLDGAGAGIGLEGLVVAAALIIALVPIALFARDFVLQRVLAAISVDIQRELTAKLLALPLSFHRESSSGDTLARILRDADRSEGALRILLAEFLQSVILAGAGVAALLFISWQLSLVAFLSAPVILAVLLRFGSRIRRGAGKRQAQLGEVTQRLTGILSGIKVIKAFRGEALEERAFRRETQRLFERVVKVAKNRAGSRALVELINNSVGVGVLVLGTVLVLRGQWGLSTGDLAAFAATLATTYKPVKNLASGWIGLQESLASAERFFEILDLESERSDAPGARSIESIGEVRFEDVHFSYGREAVLRGIDLRLRHGEVVALVGRTGAGKTTLADLLLGFADPAAGRVTIDGSDLRDLSRESLLEKCAVVTQEPFLFDTTLRENIHYGRPEASDAELRDAARAAHVDEFVDSLPEGWETPVGEFGLLLSGGQRQRITIARALLRRPALLVFDEATSALDAKTEGVIQDTLAELRGRSTVLVIAHRLSTVRLADRIVVLEDGRISQNGTHEELVRAPGLYRDLVTLQTKES